MKIYKYLFLLLTVFSLSAMQDDSIGGVDWKDDLLHTTDELGSESIFGAADGFGASVGQDTSQFKRVEDKELDGILLSDGEEEQAWSSHVDRVKVEKRTAGSSVDKYVCPIAGCGKRYTRMRNLKKHVDVHKGVWSYVCSFAGCGKGFIQRGHLKNHMLTHTRGERSYVCTFAGCGKGFIQRCHLKDHMLTHTRGERSYVCPFDGCGKKFVTSRYLKVHMHTHDDERPYVCPVAGCGKSFPRNGQLAVHMRTHKQVSREDEK